MFVQAASGRAVSPHLIPTMYHTEERKEKPVLSGTCCEPKTMLGDFMYLLSEFKPYNSPMSRAQRS